VAESAGQQLDVAEGCFQECHVALGTVHCLLLPAIRRDCRSWQLCRLHLRVVLLERLDAGVAGDA
jgi:hypothetical protein